MANEFNTALRSIRKSKGITQEQLAEAVGVTPQAVSKWEMNGFPDTPLLPLIADFLGVSVDRLFGREKTETDIRDKVVKYISALPEEEKMQSAMEICRALAISVGMLIPEYVPVSRLRFQDTENDIYSQIETDYGCIQARLNENLQYFIMMPEPEGGYDNILRYDERYVRFFKFLTKPNALKALYFLNGKGKNVYFTAEAISAELNVSVKEAESIIEEMVALRLAKDAVLSYDQGEKKIYQFVAGLNFLFLMTFVYSLNSLPNHFDMQSNPRKTEKPYFINSSYKNN
ncbi:MAG: helix-turn-helix domain-containing protein [Firmicutes bacterium]|nr:helix-turn-helix domain-containing protein [[Eubacterium] siraeum]MCM1487704.1 helix-turn-helix domain-containing protein [Bacillota bacterium]